MMLRAGAAVAIGVILAGCANSQPFPGGAFPSALGGPAQAAEADPDPGKKTLASKVLAAIALERVTGLKPDPSRFNELN